MLREIIKLIEEEKLLAATENYLCTHLRVPPSKINSELLKLKGTNVAWYQDVEGIYHFYKILE